jgi:hypothetical protein
VFGNVIGNTHQFTGSMYVSGSATFLGGITGTSATLSSYLTAVAPSSIFYGMQIYGASGGARKIFVAGQQGYSDGFAIDYNGTNFNYAFNNGNVGIGTANPSYQLDLGGGTTVNTRLRLQRGSDDTNQYGIYGWNQINLYRANVSTGSAQTDFYINQVGSDGSRTPFYISSGGNIGIGTTSPSGIFEVVGNTVDTNFGFFSTTAATNRMILAARNTGNNAEIDIRAHGSSYSETILGNSMTNAVGVVGAPQSGAAMVVGPTTNSPLILGTYNAERMRITSGGSVGIGNSSPNAKLDLGGAIGGNYKNAFFLYNDNNAGPYYGTKNGFYMDQFGLSNNTTLAFSTAAAAAGTLMFASKDTSVSDASSLTTRMTIAGQTGNVMIGTTSDNGNKLQVYGNVMATHSTAGSNGLLSNNTSNSTSYGWYNAGNGNFVLTNSNVANVGYFTMSSGAYTATSDINKKKDIELSTLGLVEILKLSPKTYRFKTEDDTADKTVGFIAQEVKDIIPNAYKEAEMPDETFIGLEYTAFIPVLVKAIQELKAEIDELKAKI